MSTYLKTTSIISLLSSVFCLDHSCVCYGCDESASFMREHQANKQTPLWVSHYKESLPKLMCENPSNFSVDQKAAIITQYLCQFVPPKVHLHDECGQTKLCTKILSLMESGKQLSFALCGFPFKSKNHKEKCLGNHVDMGEYLALMNLQVMMGNIKNFYPKAHCTIFSDGLPYHTEIDPIYDEIFAYHAQMGKLVTLFPDISFVSWKIHEGLSSYVDLQREFSQVQPKAIGDNQLSEMKAFVTKEMNTTFWQEKFLNEALQFYGFTSGETVGKRQKQVVSEKKNTLKNEKIASIVQELCERSGQFSTYVTQNIHKDFIRLSVHINDVVDVSHRLPIYFLHGYFGTPWHNTVVVGDDGSVKGFYKGKDLSKENLQKFDVSVDGENLSLSYILKS